MSTVQAGAASIGGALSHSWSMHTKPSLHGRVVSMTPNALQSAGDVQQTTGFGFEQAVANTASAPRHSNRIRAACPATDAHVNEVFENVRK